MFVYIYIYIYIYIYKNACLIGSKTYKSLDSLTRLIKVYLNISHIVPQNSKLWVILQMRWSFESPACTMQKSFLRYAHRTRHAGHCWRSRDELIRDVLLWTPTHGRAKAGRPARTYIQQLCENTGCYPEDLPRAMNDREEWWERVRDIRATSMTWWWWYIVTYMYLFTYPSTWAGCDTRSVF